MEGEVDNEMTAVIMGRRAMFEQAYIQLRQTHPSLPVQLRDFQVSCIPTHLCPEKKTLVRCLISGWRSGFCRLWHWGRPHPVLRAHGLWQDYGSPYLIFVISFTQAAFSNSKFYTRNLTKNTPKHWKMSLKSKIYAVFFVQSGKFYTWQNIFTRAPPMVPVTIMRYGYHPHRKLHY